MARPGPAGLLLVLLALLVQAAAVLSEVEFLSHLSFMLALAGLLLFAWGKAAFRLLAFPYAFTFFLVPWPDTLVEFLSFPMQLLSAKFAAMGLGLIGVPVQRDGVDIHVGSYLFSVGAPCSGMRSLVALLALSTLAAYLLRGPIRKRLGLFLLGLPLALIANVLRLQCILLLAHFCGVAVAEGFFHKFSGLVVFLLASLGLLAVGRALGLRTAPLGSTPASNAGKQETDGAGARPARLLAPSTLASSVVLSAFALALAVLTWKGPAAERPRTISFAPVPQTIGRWTGQDRGGLDQVSADMLQPDAYLGRIYRRTDGYPVDLSFVFGHRKQTFHSPGFCLLGGGWNITRKDRLRLAPSGRPLEGERVPAPAQRRGAPGCLLVCLLW